LGDGILVALLFGTALLGFRRLHPR